MAKQGIYHRLYQLQYEREELQPPRVEPAVKVS
jgi:hypothetical protein